MTRPAAILSAAYGNVGAKNPDSDARPPTTAFPMMCDQQRLWVKTSGEQCACIRSALPQSKVIGRHSEEGSFVPEPILLSAVMSRPVLALGLACRRALLCSRAKYLAAPSVTSIRLSYGTTANRHFLTAGGAAGDVPAKCHNSPSVMQVPLRIRSGPSFRFI